MEKIQINCKGNESLALSTLTPIQGNLKKLSKENKQKLRASILKHGFSFPFFVWRTPKNKVNYILDGHGRLETLLEMEKEGFILPTFPVVFIEALNLDDAKSKLLTISSQYGKFTEKGVKEFIDSFDFAPDSSLFDTIDIPFIDLSLEEPDLIDVKSHKRDMNKDGSDHLKHCPECGVILDE